MRMSWPSWSGWTGRVAGDSDAAEHVKVLTRTHQNMIWSRQRQANMLRSMLREFYPAALLAFGDDLVGRDALAVLAVAPSPNQGAHLTVGRVPTVLRKAPTTQSPGRGRAHRGRARQRSADGALWSGARIYCQCDRD
jgi:hypothetical protein